MKGKTLTRLAVLAAMVLGFLGLSQGTASAGFRWAIRTVRAPYTYYDWETQTRYRTVRKAVERTYYRTERRAVTEYRYQWKQVPERYRDRAGHLRTRRVRKQVRVPYTVYRNVQVPYTKTVYEWVTEPYTVRVRVLKTGYRAATRRVAVSVGSGGWGVTWSAGGGSQFSARLGSKRHGRHGGRPAPRPARRPAPRRAPRRGRKR